MSSYSRSLQAAALMLFAMLFFACMGIAVRMLAGQMHATVMVVLRNLMCLVIIFAWTTGLERKLPTFPTTRLRSHFWRATIGVMSMELWFYALTIMPLTLATALSFTTPIFVTIFAIIFLGERANIRRIGAIFMGFVGVTIILHPDTAGLSSNAMIVLLSSAMTAGSAVLVKSLTRTEKPETIIFYMALFMTPWSIPPSLPHWQPFTLEQLWLVFLVAFFSTAAHLMTTRAYVRADMTALMPFDFTRLIFIAILAYFFFGETIDRYTIAGSLLIVASTVYIARREARARMLAAVKPA